MFLAANDTSIDVDGEAEIVIKVGDISTTSRVLVSKHILEPTLGIDGCSKNSCSWKFGTGEISIAGNKCPLKSRPTRKMCCRVIATSDITVPVGSQAVFSTQLECSDLRSLAAPMVCTEIDEIVPGVRVARTLISANSKKDCIPIQLMNVTGKDATIAKNTIVAEVSPVNLVPSYNESMTILVEQLMMKTVTVIFKS